MDQFVSRSHRLSHDRLPPLRPARTPRTRASATRAGPSWPIRTRPARCERPSRALLRRRRIDRARRPLDPEVMRGVMARFYAAIREPVERHGGTRREGDRRRARGGVRDPARPRGRRAAGRACGARDARRRARAGRDPGPDRREHRRRARPRRDAGRVARRGRRRERGGPAASRRPARARCSSARRPGRSSPTPSAASSRRRSPRRASASRWSPGGSRVSTRRAAATAAGSICPWSGARRSSTLLRWALERADQTQRPHLVTVLGPARDRQVAAGRGGARGCATA